MAPACGGPSNWNWWFATTEPVRPSRSRRTPLCRLQTRALSAAWVELVRVAGGREEGERPTSTADSRLPWCPTFRVPIVKLPAALSWQSEGGGFAGAMPSSTAWARPEAAKRRGAKTVEVRIMREARKGYFVVLLVKWMQKRKIRCSAQEDAVVGTKIRWDSRQTRQREMEVGYAASFSLVQHSRPPFPQARTRPRGNQAVPAGFRCIWRSDPPTEQ
jgi:hypothetical protein